GRSRSASPIGSRLRSRRAPARTSKRVPGSSTTRVANAPMPRESSSCCPNEWRALRSAPISATAPVTFGGPMSVPEVDIDEVARGRGEGVLLIDVRQPEEYDAGHVPGARLIPLSEVGLRVREVPTDE